TARGARLLLCAGAPSPARLAEGSHSRALGGAASPRFPLATTPTRLPRVGPAVGTPPRADGGRSLRVINRAGFANDRHFDLAGIFELVLDSPGDVLREPDGFFVRDLLAFDHDADFTAGLQRERLRDAFERVGNAFELLEPLDVRLEDIAACAGARGGYRVGRLHDHRFERRPVDVHVVRRHRHHHRLALAVFSQEVDAELEVRPLHVAIDGLFGDLAAVGIEPGHDDRARRVVDDEIDASGELERADVASFAADDAALEIVAREIDHRDRGLDRVLRGTSLNGLGDVVLGAV